jgi:adenylosuccinate lyase
VALWHERDISHSSTERIILPDACTLLDYALALFTSVMKGLKVNTTRMKQNMKLSHGLIFSQRVMLALIEKGLSREQAYKLCQRNAMKAWDKKRNLLSLLKADKDITGTLSTAELEALFDEQYYLHHVDDIFQRLGLTGRQWQEKTGAVKPEDLSPRSI